MIEDIKGPQTFSMRLEKDGNMNLHGEQCSYAFIAMAAGSLAETISAHETPDNLIMTTIFCEALVQTAFNQGRNGLRALRSFIEKLQGYADTLQDPEKYDDEEEDKTDEKK